MGRMKRRHQIMCVGSPLPYESMGAWLIVQTYKTRPTAITIQKSLASDKTLLAPHRYATTHRAPCARSLHGIVVRHRSQAYAGVPSPSPAYPIAADSLPYRKQFRLPSPAWSNPCAGSQVLGRTATCGRGGLQYEIVFQTRKSGEAGSQASR